VRTRNSDAERTTMMRTAAHRTEPTSPETLLNAREVQAVLRCSRAQCYGFLRYSIPIVKLGRSVRVRQAALDSWLRERETVAGPSS
jgi:predicted DNA-binding transcriptional regulator AlpA